MKAKEKKLSDLLKSPFPETIKPMLATLTDKAFNNKEWIFEIKWDGYRTITRKKGKLVSLSSRNLTSFDKQFHTIKKSLAAINNDVVLDGEVVAVDENNMPGFQILQNYQKTGIGNIVYYVFDLLWFKGYDTKKLTVIERKELLKSILPEMDNIFYCDHIAEKGISLFKEAKQTGLEGIIAKKANSLYYENTRSHSWLKIKTTQAMEAVVCGYTEPRGSRKYFGALILGVFDKGKLTYIGHTGTGFNENNQKTVYNLMQKYVSAVSPFEKTPKPNAPVTWLKPKIVCEVKYSQLTEDNILRHPVFIKIRDDKKPSEVTLKSQIK
ncbi:MAG: non-homologous end-joining DNA ligase [Ignavibacteria bacterium]